MRLERGSTDASTSHVLPRVASSPNALRPLSAAPRTTLALDLNENTRGPSPRVLAALRTAAREELGRYPNAEPFLEALSAFLDVERGSLLCSNGSVQALERVIAERVCPGGEFVIPCPSFPLAAAYAAQMGGTVVPVDYGPDDYRFPAEAIARAIGPNTRLVVLTNPNNPTGTVIAPSAIEALVAAFPDTPFLIDEAYAAYAGLTHVGLVARHANALVVGTFSKAFGLASLRLGYLVAQPAWVQRLAPRFLPYDVNSWALRAGCAALDDLPYVREHVAEVIAGREHLFAALEAAGARPHPSGANFILADFGARARRVLGALRERGIRVRDLIDDPATRNCLRLSLGTLSETSALITALRSCA